MSDGTRRIDDAIEAALRGWPARERSEPEWEALARRIEERLDDAAALPHFDPTQKPVFEDEVGAETPAAPQAVREPGRGRGPLVVVALAAALALGVGVTAMLSVTGDEAGEMAFAPPVTEPAPSGAAVDREEAAPLAEPTPAAPPELRHREAQQARSGDPYGEGAPAVEPTSPAEEAEGLETDLGHAAGESPRPGGSTDGTTQRLADGAGHCGNDGTVTVRVAVDRTGSVGRVQVIGADSTVRACIEHDVRQVRFPSRFWGATARFRIELGEYATATEL